MGIKSTYYGLYGDDYTAARARAEMNADAYADVLRRENDRLRELDKQAQLSREIAQSQYEYENSVGYKLNNRLTFNDIAQWNYVHGEQEAAIKQAFAPNLPDDINEANEVIEYEQTNGEYPAPYARDTELKKLYAKVIQYRLDGNNLYAENCSKRTVLYWRNMVLAAFYALTNCPKPETAAHIHKYIGSYLKPYQLTFMQKTEIQTRIDRCQFYLKDNYPIPAELQAACEADTQRVNELNIAASTCIWELYNYLITYNQDLKITRTWISDRISSMDYL